jgi:hypothetical protein
MFLIARSTILPELRFNNIQICSFEEFFDNGFHIHSAHIAIVLPDTNKHDGDSRRVGHTDSGTNLSYTAFGEVQSTEKFDHLIVYRVKLSQDNTIDHSLIVVGR